jgi:hypothetical protein
LYHDITIRQTVDTLTNNFLAADGAMMYDMIPKKKNKEAQTTASVIFNDYGALNCWSK